MMNYNPYGMTFWQTKPYKPNVLSENIEVDVAIVGGGITGLSAAAAAQEKGLRVVLCEQYSCGSGASGRSSGFITPNAELSCSDFQKIYGPHGAKIIWDMITRGVRSIQKHQSDFSIACDMQPMKTLVLANHARDMKKLQEEHKTLKTFHYETELYDQHAVLKHIGSQKYAGGLLYPDSFSIQPYAYCQGLKETLIQKGVLIFEESPAVTLDAHTVYTPHGSIRARYTIVCVDKFLPDLGYLKDSIHHAQTFVMISEPLPSKYIQALFPQENYMAWDSELIYNYFRPTLDNRLILGGGNFISTYLSEKYNYKPMYTKLTHYFKKYFPHIPVEFSYMWPGLIGLSKDIVPIAGRDIIHKNRYYISAAMGLPIAASLGHYSIEHLFDNRNDLDGYFNPYRSFPVQGWIQKIIGKKAAFALSNVIKQNVP